MSIGPFQLKPRIKPYKDGYSRSHIKAGKNYHAKFSALKGRRLAWNLEKKDFK